MKKLNRRCLCESIISNKARLFILEEEIEDWDYDKKVTKSIKKGSPICIECLIDYIDDTERVPRTSPQIEYRYVSVK